ncbi:HDOD domain-containing protein [Azohydromonas sp.]|uniref:HDOD domain-containing protein n=1 Tax=Azohydromonas sp. TaxID=1872666 RepID=UPI002C518800|nr:HDOD domain-containing protein [Azohydromonas sp.]HMM84647.1 HDOD domain-containing protein [Azohydromonas sp.]
MPVDPELRSLDIDIPAQPEALVKLSLLLAEDEINLQAVSALIESDMALAASVMKAVNSSLYGLKGRVQTVQQAITYLGMREVAAITFEMGLRAAFPPAPELEPIWQRAAVRGMVMGRMGQQLGVDGWAAHSAGLFEECGKAVLFRHASDHYRSMLRAAANDLELISLERAGFGVSHEALGAALCESWGLAAPAVASVRHHVEVQAGADLPAGMQRTAVLALSAVAAVLMRDADQLEAVVQRVAPQVPLDETLVLRAARKVHEHLEEARAHGR